MSDSSIVIRGAREHNLRNIDVSIPRDELVVITGLSGSGKSSLAFDTIYAEGQRRYVESLSSYARQFLGQMDKPDLDSIDGLSPAVSIDQKTTSKNPRSTVGTVTEIYDYLRLLFARWARHTAPSAVALSNARPPTRSPIRSWQRERVVVRLCWHRWCAGAKASTQNCSRIFGLRALAACVSTAKYARSTTPSIWTKSSSTISRS